MGKIEKITWETPEYKHKKKGADWYLALIIIAIFSSAASFLLNNILFGIFILLGVSTIIMYAIRKPRILSIELTNHGVLVGDTLYPHNTIKSFWVEDDSEEPKIIMQSKKVLMPYIVIPLGETDPDITRDFLLEYLEEEEHHEPLLQKLMEYLGF